MNKQKRRGFFVLGINSESVAVGLTVAAPPREVFDGFQQVAAQDPDGLLWLVEFWDRLAPFGAGLLPGDEIRVVGRLRTPDGVNELVADNAEVVESP